MTKVLILSSFVAASRVGGRAQAEALVRLGIEPMLVPTVLYGRHPGLGAPGGAAVAAETMASILDGIKAQGVFEQTDAAIFGYFATPDQVAVAVKTLQAIRRANPDARLIVDPILGDHDVGLYVPPDVQHAVTETLVPLAEIVIPNAWELGAITGIEVKDGKSAAAAARKLGRPVLVSSVPAEEDHIGVVYADDEGAWIAHHTKASIAPRGAGDLLTVFYAAAVVQGCAPRDALELAAAVTADAVAYAHGASEFLLSSLPRELQPSFRIVFEAVE
ncbi:MAG TPA: PfkB family carbohydrate kinase [Caulobacteraceae bacterium]|nr:PfkB family carbohydrate kinase [Caulobacteraceae bacterium]